MVAVAIQKTSCKRRFSLQSLVLSSISAIFLGVACMRVLYNFRTPEEKELHFLLQEPASFSLSSSSISPLSSEEIAEHEYFNPLENAISKFSDKRPRRFCPCCGWSGEMFEGKKNSGIGATIPDRSCPKCHALERHRKACGMFGCSHNHTILASRVHEDMPFRLLHFGPEKAMTKYINSFLPSIDQVGLDYFASGHDFHYNKETTLHADVTNLNFPDNFANGIIILHVLEHILALEIAIKELIRVLAYGGWAMIEVPCTKNGETTDCRHLKNSTAGLTKCAGQRDHVWKFNCLDFKKRVEECGMKCEVWNQLDHQSDCFDSDVRKSILPMSDRKGTGALMLLCRHAG